MFDFLWKKKYKWLGKPLFTLNVKASWTFGGHLASSGTVKGSRADGSTQRFQRQGRSTDNYFPVWKKLYQILLAALHTHLNVFLTDKESKQWCNVICITWYSLCYVNALGLTSSLYYPVTVLNRVEIKQWSFFLINSSSINHKSLDILQSNRKGEVGAIELLSVRCSGSWK